MFIGGTHNNFQLTHLWDPPILGESTIYDGRVNTQHSRRVGHILAGAQYCGIGIGNDRVDILTAARYPP